MIAAELVLFRWNLMSIARKTTLFSLVSLLEYWKGSLVSILEYWKGSKRFQNKEEKSFSAPLPLLHLRQTLSHILGKCFWKSDRIVFSWSGMSMLDVNGCQSSHLIQVCASLSWTSPFVLLLHYPHHCDLYNI